MSKPGPTHVPDFQQKLHQLLNQFDEILDFCDSLIEVRRADRVERREAFDLFPMGMGIVKKPLVNEAAFWAISSEHAKLLEVVASVQSGRDLNHESILAVLREIIDRARIAKSKL